MPRVVSFEELDAVLRSGGAADALRQFKGDMVPARFLRQLAAAAEPESDLFLSGWPDTPAKILEELAGRSAANSELAGALVRHSRTPAKILEELAGSGGRETRDLLARNRQLSLTLAEELAGDPDPAVRARLAANPALPARLQATLARDPVGFVRTSLAHNPRLDAGVLHDLTGGDDLIACAAVLLDARVGDEQLLEWADSDDFYRQFFLLQRESLPESILESLCFSRHPRLQEQAVARRRLSEDELLGWTEKGTPAIRAIIAAKPDLPPVIQKRLAEDVDPEVRLALAANPHLDAAVALRLAQVDDPALWRVLAANLALPAAAVSELCREPDPRLAKLLAARPGLTAEQAGLLLRHGGEELAAHLSVHGCEITGLKSGVAEGWAGHRLPALRALAAASAQLSLPACKRLSIDPVPMVRQRLAGNPALPETLLRFLSTDADPATAARAAAVLAARAGAAPAALAAPGKAQTADDHSLVPDPGTVLKRLIRKVVGKKS